MHIEGLDKYDNNILELLKSNARMSCTDIGKRAGLSRVAVRNRISAMEKQGIIRGYTVITEPANAPRGRHFFLDIITEPERFNEIAASVAKHDVIRKVYAVTGESRFRAEGFAADNAGYEMFLRELKRSLAGVKSCTLQDALYTIKDADGVQPEGETAVKA